MWDSSGVYSDRVYWVVWESGVFSSLRAYSASVCLWVWDRWARIFFMPAAVPGNPSPLVCRYAGWVPRGYVRGNHRTPGIKGAPLCAGGRACGREHTGSMRGRTTGTNNTGALLCGRPHPRRHPEHRDDTDQRKRGDAVHAVASNHRADIADHTRPGNGGGRCGARCCVARPRMGGDINDRSRSEKRREMRRPLRLCTFPALFSPGEKPFMYLSITPGMRWAILPTFGIIPAFRFLLRLGLARVASPLAAGLFHRVSSRQRRGSRRVLTRFVRELYRNLPLFLRSALLLRPFCRLCPIYGTQPVRLIWGVVSHMMDIWKTTAARCFPHTHMMENIRPLLVYSCIEHMFFIRNFDLRNGGGSFERFPLV